jgi:transposase
LATVDVPFRFSNSKAVGAALGLTPRRQQSGEIDRMGGISKCGPLMRETLFEVALVLMTHRGKWSWLQGLGHEDCAAPWHGARDRRCGATAGGHHASHVGGWHRSVAGPGKKL